MTRTLVRVPDGKTALETAKSAHRPRRHLAPQLLEPIERARLRREDVHDAVEVVHQDPAGLPVALRAPWQQPGRVLQLFVDRVVDRLRLALRVAGADHEV